jgi:FlaA1/EpsC-like NDP-sugar epimerase
MLFDLLIVSLSFLLTMTAASFQFGQVSFAQFLSMRVKIGNFLIFLGFLLLWHFIFSFFELYKQRCLLIQRREFIDIVKGTTVGTALLSVFTFIFSFEMVTPVFIAAFWALTISKTVFGRSLLRMVLKQLSITHNEIRHLLIVGTNQKAVEFSRKIENSALGFYSIVG